ncbi:MULTISPECIES: hypothetical protein [Streptomyces]|uniref:hypothetical protein n=1 Tax=Streptomyces TaxID=1883 RepID=UPI00345FFDEF
MAKSLYPLLLLACPVGMGLMMWFMVRHGHQGNGAHLSQDEADSLRRELKALRAEREERSAGLPRN